MCEHSRPWSTLIFTNFINWSTKWHDRRSFECAFRPCRSFWRNLQRFREATRAVLTISHIDWKEPQNFMNSGLRTSKNGRKKTSEDIPPLGVHVYLEMICFGVFGSPSASMLQSFPVAGSVRLERDKTFPVVRRMVGTFVTLTGLVLACHPGHPSKEPWASNSHHTIHMCKYMIKVVILVAAGPIFGWSEEVDVQRVIWGVTLQILGHSLQDIRSRRSTWKQFERSPKITSHPVTSISLECHVKLTNPPTSATSTDSQVLHTGIQRNHLRTTLLKQLHLKSSAKIKVFK